MVRLVRGRFWWTELRHHCLIFMVKRVKSKGQVSHKEMGGQVVGMRPSETRKSWLVNVPQGCWAGGREHYFYKDPVSRWSHFHRYQDLDFNIHFGGTHFNPLHVVCQISSFDLQFYILPFSTVLSDPGGWLTWATSMDSHKLWLLAGFSEMGSSRNRLERLRRVRPENLFTWFPSLRWPQLCCAPWQKFARPPALFDSGSFPPPVNSLSCSLYQGLGFW